MRRSLVMLVLLAAACSGGASPSSAHHATSARPTRPARTKQPPPIEAFATVGPTASDRPIRRNEVVYASGLLHYKGRRYPHYTTKVRLYRAPAAHPADAQRIPAPFGRNLSVGGLAVSPNGRKIAEFIGYYGDAAFKPPGCTMPRGCAEMLVTVHADGKHLKVLWIGNYAKGPDRPISWSPDGKRLYYDVEPPALHHHQGRYVHLVSVSTTAVHPRPQRVPGGRGLVSPAVSPDGRTLAAVRPRFARSGFARASSLVTLDLATGRVSAPLVTEPSPGEPYLSMMRPAWAPDGSKIAVAYYTSQQNVGDRLPGAIDIVTADGSSDGSPIVIPTDRRHLPHSLVWRTSSELWFARNVQADGDIDGLEGESLPSNLYSVRVFDHSAGELRRRTATPDRDEQILSFGGR